MGDDDDGGNYKEDLEHEDNDTDENEVNGDDD
jgi:hypothetical protein